MRFLTFALLIFGALGALFLVVDGKGSGMGWPVVIAAVLFGLCLVINKARTGKWFTDSSGGH